MTMTTALLNTIAGNAKAVDRNELSARYGIELLGSLQETARQLREIATVDLSVAFGIWAHTMVITYLRTADTDYVRYVLPALENGTRPGVTGMAPAFKEAAGAGTIDLTATPAEDGYVLNGTLAWASNLADDAVIVTAARTPSGGAPARRLRRLRPGRHPRHPLRAARPQRHLLCRGHPGQRPGPGGPGALP